MTLAVRLAARRREPVSPRAVRPARGRHRHRAGPRRDLRRVRPPDRLGPRLRQLAALRLDAVPRAPLPPDGRVREPASSRCAGSSRRSRPGYASRRVAGLPRWVVRVALAAFLGTVAQIPLGGITVILDLHPLAVMSHFLLALVVVGALRRRRVRGVEPRERPRRTRRAAVAAPRRGSSASSRAPRWWSPGRSRRRPGPHPGADQDVHRLGLGIRDTVYVHVRATAVFGIGLLFVGWQLLRAAAGGARGRARWRSSCSRCCSRRCSWARSSTETRSRGGSSSST